MKKYLALLPLCWGSHTLASEVVVIGGFQHTITEFEQSGRTHRLARVEVLGDDGVTPVNFVITADIRGKGKIIPEFKCVYPQTGYASCSSYDDPDIHHFVFALGLTATCIADDGSRLLIEKDSDQKNLRTPNTIINKDREFTLGIHKKLVTHNQCRELEVRIDGTLSEIQQLDLNVILFNEF